MRILDMTAGNRGIWFNKNHPEALYMDIRPEVKPDIVADFRENSIPAYTIANPYDLVVFDPPHLNFGAKSNMSKCYGHHTTAEILELVEKGAEHAWRVTRPDALMAFKWFETPCRVIAKSG